MTSASVLKLGEYYDHDSFKKEVFENLTDLEKHKPLFDKVLVATYLEPSKTKGGVILPDKNREEGRFQGKMGLILALGPTAFEYDGPYKYEGIKPQVGDWVLHYPSNTREFFLYNYSCRLVPSDLLELVSGDPSAIW
jgi:co-chaperonin GroES (HSP10)